MTRQSAEARLYTFSQETKDHLRKFRLGTSRASGPQAVICMYVSSSHWVSFTSLLQLRPGPPSQPPTPPLTPGRTDLIDKQTKEIRQDEDEVVYKSLEELADDLPDHSPRFVLLSYPLTLVSLSLPSTSPPT